MQTLDNHFIWIHYILRIYVYQRCGMKHKWINTLSKPLPGHLYPFTLVTVAISGEFQSNESGHALKRYMDLDLQAHPHYHLEP